MSLLTIPFVVGKPPNESVNRKYEGNRNLLSFSEVRDGMHLTGRGMNWPVGAP